MIPDKYYYNICETKQQQHFNISAHVLILREGKDLLAYCSKLQRIAAVRLPLKGVTKRHI